ncbi:MAG: Holliday junction resolvase RuvX [Leptospirales bacterium]
MKLSPRLLAIDFGLQRVGFAVTDEMQITITPLPVLEFQKPEFWNRFTALLNEYKPQKIILGYPQHDLETLNRIQRQIIEFKNRIEKNFTIPVLLHDESYSSEQASDHLNELTPKRSKKKTVQKKGKRDSVAAGFILQSFLKKNSTED